MTLSYVFFSFVVFGRETACVRILLVLLKAVTGGIAKQEQYMNI